MKGFEDIQQNSVEKSDHLEYLHATESEKFNARLKLQEMVMARMLGIVVSVEDKIEADEGKNEMIQKEWIDAGLSVKFADVLKEHPNLIFKFLHAGEYTSSPVNESDVVDEVVELLHDKHEIAN